MTKPCKTWVPALFAAATLPAIALAGAPGHDGVPARASIQGVWDSTVTLRACGGPPVRSFRAINLFERDGSLVATSVAVPPPSLGQWRWLGGRTFRAQFQLMRLGAGGVFEGMTRITREIQVAPDGRSFTGVVRTELFDLSDTLFQEGCGEEIANRVY